MNVQTEHIEKHTARLTVEITNERLETAKQKAARKLSQRVNIPGFRKGKAPYNIIVKYFGEPALIEEALEELGQEVYREALDASGIEPYGPGSFEDFKLDPAPTLVYTIPKAPVVDLGDYRTTRVEFSAPVVTDEDIERQIELMREERAQYADIEGEAVAAIDNRVTVDLHSYIIDPNAPVIEEDDIDDEDDDIEEDDDIDDEEDDIDDEDDDDDDEEDDDDHDHDHDHGHGDSVVDDPKYQHGETYVHQHNLPVMLREGTNEPLAPGFTAAMVGVKAGETREFDIDFPDDEKYSAEVRGKTVKFVVHVNKVESAVLPELNDEFAASVTELFKETAEQELEPLTMENLKAKLRANMEKEASVEATENYANQVLDKLVEQAQIAFPDEMVEDEIDELMKSLENNLRQQGASLDFFKQISGKTDEDLRNDYREVASKRVERGLVFTEFAAKEKIRISEEELNEKIEELLKPFGAQAEGIRSTFTKPNFLNNIANRMLTDKTNERLALVGKGEAPELTDEDANTEGKAGAAEAVESTEDAEAANSES